VGTERTLVRKAGKRPGLDRGYFLKGSAAMLAMKVTGIALSFGITVLLARKLGTDQFGLYAFALSVATMLALPLIGGLPTLLVREIASARAAETPEIVRGVVRWGYLVVGAVTLALGAAVTAYVGGLSLSLWSAREETVRLVLLVALIVPLIGLMHVQRSLLGGHQRVVLGTAGEQVLRPTLLLLFLLAALPFIEGNAGSALLLYAAATLAVVLAVMPTIRRTLQPANGSPALSRGREWMLALLPLTAISATAIIKNNTDMLMLGALQPMEEVAIYKIGAQVAALAAFMMQILRSLAAPTISAAHTLGDRESLRAQLVLVAQASFAGALLALILFSLFGQRLLNDVFGADYVGSYWPCLVLILGWTVSAACGLGNLLLQVTRHADLVARAAVISAVTNAVLNFLLVPLLGALGAAISTAFTIITMQFQLWVMARRVMGLRTDALQWVRK